MSKTVIKIVIGVWAAFLLGCLAFYMFFYAVRNNVGGYFGKIPGIEFIENPTTELASELYSEDGVLLGKYFRENRTNVDFEELSPNVVNALIATEDIRFYKHSGVDLWALFRVFKGVVTGNSAGGGSTLSQQLAKNIFRMRDNPIYRGPAYDTKLRMLVVKVKEWIVSARLEQSYTKNEILTMYLNTVEMGSNAYGIKSASVTFFGVLPSELTAEQAAVLVGLLKAPTFYNPQLNPKNSKERRNVVLHQMYKYDFITEAEKDSLQKISLALNYDVENHATGLAPYFRTIVKNQMVRWCKANGYDLFEDGLKIYTTINTKLQIMAEDAVKKHLIILQKRFNQHWNGQNPWVDENGKELSDYPHLALARTDVYKKLKAKYGNKKDSIDYYVNIKKPMTVFTWQGERDTVMSIMDSLLYYKKFLQAGMASIDPRTGQIKAWVGGMNYKYFKFDHVKQGARQPGSTFKPFIYLAAIESGYSPCDSILDDVVVFRTETVDGVKEWKPENFDNVYTRRNYSLRHALAESKNVIAARVMQQIGAENAVKYAQLLGITTPMQPVPSLCLGTEDVKLIDMIGAYSTFVNEGVWTEPIFITRIEDKNGRVLKTFTAETKQVISKRSADIMCYMLQGATSWEYRDHNGEPAGTAVRLRTGNMHELGGERWEFDNQIGAKTGTTSNYSDGWFMGLTPDLVTGIWVGAEDRAIHFRTGHYGQGSRMAMPIFGHYMKSAYADSSTHISKRPFRPEVDRIGKELCSKTKKLVNDSTVTEIIIKNNKNPIVD